MANCGASPQQNHCLLDTGAFSQVEKQFCLKVSSRVKQRGCHTRPLCADQIPFGSASLPLILGQHSSRAHTWKKAFRDQHFSAVRNGVFLKALTLFQAQFFSWFSLHSLLKNILPFKHSILLLLYFLGKLCKLC